MNIDNEDFGIVAVCAIRYCQGRETYMPDLVRRIVRGHIAEVTDKDLQVMINDCECQSAFGNENIDKPKWIEWKDFLINEQERRTGESTTQGNCDWYTSDIRWTDKLSVTCDGDIIDFNGRVVGHINSEIMKGGAENDNKV